MQTDLLVDFPYRSLAELLDYQAQYYPNKTYLLYPDLSSNLLCYASATFAQVNNITNCLANKYAEQMDLSSELSKRKIVGILANTSANFLLTAYGLSKLNVIFFPVSIRLPKETLEYLIKTVEMSYLIVDEGQIQIELEGLKIIPLENVDWTNKDKTSCLINKREKDLWETPQLIFHSSGSTGCPKPIPYTNRGVFLINAIQTNVNANFWEEDDVVLTCGALFHVVAFSTAVACLLHRSTFAIPLAKTYPPTPKQLLANVRIEQINKMMSVPTLLEQLSLELESDPTASYKILSRMKFIVYGGAIMPDKICQKFVNNDVHLVSMYGSSETNMMMMKDLNAPKTRYKWMKVAECRRPFIKIRSEDQVLVHLPNDPFCAPGVSNLPDGSYATNDIMFEEPPGSGEYRIEGRQDDRLVHINGEKTNAIPMETILCQFPIVKRAVIIGHERLCTGVLIQLNREEAEKYFLDEIFDHVWEAVEAANHSAPTHSRIVRQMVKCLPMNRILPVTDKGNMLRKRVNQEYETIINDLYDKFLSSTSKIQVSSISHQDWTDTSLRNYLHELISKISLKNHSNLMNSSQSIFEIGFDSLHAVQLYNELSLLFPSIPFNFVYEYPSIDSMVKELLSKNEKKFLKDNQDHRLQYMLTEELLDKYINLMKNDRFTNNGVRKKTEERIFLITGANGSLGSWLILELLKQKSVTKIFCLFRGQDRKRIVKSFEKRHQPTDIFNNNDNRIVLLNNMILSDELLGQDIDIYTQLCNEITDIIHSAYRMDFNLTVTDFEKDCILGTYNLLKLANKADARFHFISSIASSGSSIKPLIKEEPLIRRPELAIAHGYGQSKYICEHLSTTAKHLWNISVDIYRVGQISGDSQNGAWNTSEMISMIIGIGAGKLGQIPSESENIRWIPVNIVASIISDIALQNYIEDDDIHHIVNPYVITWSTFLDYLQISNLHFSRVNTNEWLDTVLHSQTDLVRLLPFFKTFFTSQAGFRTSKYETIKTEARSKHLHSCPPINLELIQKYLSFWRNTKFITNENH